MTTKNSPATPRDHTTHLPQRIAKRRRPQDIDLTAAEMVIKSDLERQYWLTQMLEPGGMAPGSSSRAHARAFRFAEALMKAGYVVGVKPLGPRGGRRFTLDSYEGRRAGLLYQLQMHRGCQSEHSVEECGCFEDLSDEQLRLVRALYRRLRATMGSYYETDRIAETVRRYGEDTTRRAVDLCASLRRAGTRGDVKACAELIEAHGWDTVRAAADWHLAAGGTARNAPSVSDWVELAHRSPHTTLETAACLRKGCDPGSAAPALIDLLDAIQAASQDG